VKAASGCASSSIDIASGADFPDTMRRSALEDQITANREQVAGRTELLVLAGRSY
jgi:hypothetical protein